MSNNVGSIDLIVLNAGPSPFTFIIVTVGTRIRAITIMIPCTKSVQLTAKKPPNNVSYNNACNNE